MRIITIILLACAFIFAYTHRFYTPAKYYMSATGSDAAAGTSSGAPWQTLTKLNSQTLGAGDTVFFNRGDQFYGRLNCTRTGSAGNPVVYTAYGTGADPVITGYTTLSGWVNNGSNIWAAAAPGIKAYAHNVIKDGVFQNIAREPNTGFITFTPSSTTSIIDPLLTGTPDHTGDSVVVKSSRYTLDHAKVTAQATTTLTLSGVTYSGAGGIGYFWFNSPKWLNAPGEWVVNSTQDSIQTYSVGTPTGVWQAATIDTVVYATGAYNHMEHIQVIGGNMYNVLNAFGTGNISLNYCYLAYGYTGIDIRAQHDTVDHCTIKNFLNNGIMSPTNNVTKYSAVTNNTIGAIGLWPGMGKTGTGNYEGVFNPSDGFVCMFNDVDSTGGNGIYSNFDSVMIKWNHVNHFGVTLADVGGIYVWSQNKTTYTHQLEVVGNLVENGFGNIEGIVYDPGTMASGIYYDGKSNMILTTDNTSINNSGCGFFDHGTNIPYYRNRAYGNLLAQAMVSEFAGQPITGIDFKYNAFASADTLIPVMFWYAPSGSSDLTSFGTCDSNYYMSGTGSIAAFRTQQNGGSVIKRSLADWQTFFSFDAASTHQKGKIVAAYNGSMADKNTYLTGRYTGPDATTYNQLVPTPKLYAIPLIENDKGYVTIPPGSKIVAH